MSLKSFHTNNVEKTLSCSEPNGACCSKEFKKRKDFKLFSNKLAFNGFILPGKIHRGPQSQGK